MKKYFLGNFIIKFTGIVAQTLAVFLKPMEKGF
jgi:hypothetical protein